MVKVITPDDSRACNKFALTMLQKLDEDKKIVFSDKAEFVFLQR
jgi:hypothetical protein